MDTENKKAWEILFDSIEKQEQDIRRLKEREIELLKLIMELEDKNREQVKAFSQDYFKRKKEAESQTLPPSDEPKET